MTENWSQTGIKTCEQYISTQEKEAFPTMGFYYFMKLMAKGSS